MTDPEPLLRVRDVALRLAVSPRTVKRYIAAGRLQAQQLPSSHWRISVSSLAACEGRQGVSGPAVSDVREQVARLEQHVADLRQ